MYVGIYSGVTDVGGSDVYSWTPYGVRQRPPAQG